MNLKKKFEILTYNVGFITKGIDDVMEKGLEKGDIVWMKHAYKDRFFADPFLLTSDEAYFYLLCEEYIFWEEKGKIVLLKVRRDDFVLEERKIVIEEETHLSFPFCRYGEGVVMPESSASGRYTAYILDLNTMEVVSKKVVLEEGTIDAVAFEKDGETWLLTGKTGNPSAELFLYKKDKDGNYIQIFEEPVLSDHRRSRSAGLFFSWNGKVYRPVQDCQGRYGRQTKIMELEFLGEDGYGAKEYLTVNSFDNPPFHETMHTFNVYNECIVVDGSKDILRFPMKFFYKKMRFLFRKRRDENEAKFI